MTYLVTKIYYNGYRCSCCMRKWPGQSQEFENRDEALKQIPQEWAKPDNELDINFDLADIRVTEKDSGNIIAEGYLSWTGSRSDRYDYSKWSGYIDGTNFENIYDRVGNKIFKSWANVSKELDIKMYKEKFLDAKVKYDDSKKYLTFYSEMLKDLGLEISEDFVIKENK